MKTSHVVAALVAGAAAGAAVGLLFAPDKGSKTRKKLSEAGADLAGTLKDKFDSMVNSALFTYEEAKDGYEGLKDKVSDIKDKASNGIHQISDTAKSLTSK